MTWSENMPASKEKMEYIDKWQKENTDTVKFRVPKGRKELYMELAKRNNKSLTAYITDLLEEKLKEEQ